MCKMTLYINKIVFKLKLSGFRKASPLSRLHFSVRALLRREFRSPLKMSLKCKTVKTEFQYFLYHHSHTMANISVIFNFSRTGSFIPLCNA